MSELKLCPFCGTLPQANTWIFRGISETRYFCPNQECPLSVRAVTLERWNSRPIEDALTARIAKLEAERRWIPVSEGLPKENAPVLVLTVLGGMFVDFIHGKSVVTGNPDFYELDVEDVTHWMPLPELPEVQQ